MNIGALQTQVWLTTIIAVSAIGIAVLAIALKMKSDRLRKAARKVHARQVDDHLCFLDQTAPSVPAPAAQKRLAEPSTPATTEQVVGAACDTVAINLHAPRDSDVRNRNIAIRRAEMRALDFAASQGRRRHPGASECLPKLDETSPREALSEWLNKRAAARCSQKTVPAQPGSSLPQHAAAADPTPEPEKVLPTDVEHHTAAPEPERPVVFIDEALWESILGRSASEKPIHHTVSSPRLELIQGTGSGIPSGLQDETVLRRLLELNKPFNGLAIALGVSLSDGRPVSRELLPHIQQLVRTLLEQDDFACQTADDEFLILCPGTQADESQRRLRAISELLWEFQLRGAGNFSIHFHTCDAQVSGEPLRAATSAASARLQHTRRPRCIDSSESVSRNTAVAGL